MTRLAPLPSHDQVLAALSQMRAEAAVTGRPPAVLGLARRLGLANTTFRRNFPDVAAELARTAAAAGHGPLPASRHEQLSQDNAGLRRSNRELREHLQLAVAGIQRLTLENHRLREQLEAAAKITRINPGPARPQPPL